jgi:hypothetical protein
MVGERGTRMLDDVLFSWNENHRSKTSHLQWPKPTGIIDNHKILLLSSLSISLS